MTQLTKYLAATSGNWDAANAWSDTAGGAGNFTNPQNGADTYICDLNNKLVYISTGIVVDQIRTGITNSGGQIKVPNLTAANITVTTPTSGIWSNYSGPIQIWGTGTCSLVINGDAQYAGAGVSATSMFYTSNTLGSLTISGQCSTSSTCAGHFAYLYGGPFVVSNPTGIALLSGGSAGSRVIYGYTQTPCTINGTLTCTLGGVGYAFYGSASPGIINGDIITMSGRQIVALGSSATINGNLSGWNALIVGISAGQGNTVTWSGNRTLAASSECSITINYGTLNLRMAGTPFTPLNLSNSGTFAIFVNPGTILNTNSTGSGIASIVNKTNTSYAVILGGTDAQKSIITRQTVSNPIIVIRRN